MDSWQVLRQSKLTSLDFFGGAFFRMLKQVLTVDDGASMVTVKVVALFVVCIHNAPDMCCTLYVSRLERWANACLLHPVHMSIFIAVQVSIHSILNIEDTFDNMT